MAKKVIGNKVVKGKASSPVKPKPLLVSTTNEPLQHLKFRPTRTKITVSGTKDSYKADLAELLANRPPRTKVVKVRTRVIKYSDRYAQRARPFEPLGKHLAEPIYRRDFYFEP